MVAVSHVMWAADFGFEMPGKAAVRQQATFGERKLMIRKTKIKSGKKKLSWAKRKTREKNRMIAALDADCRRRVNERDLETCQRAEYSECTGPLQWSHVISREVKALRWEEENSQMLCLGHHHWWHMNHSQAILWFSTKWPERWEHLQRAMQGNTKFGDTEIRELYEQL